MIKHTIELRKITEKKKAYMPLLLLADEQEDMVLRYLDRGELFAAYENEDLVGVCVMTKEPKYGAEVYEVKNLAVAEDLQHQGYGSSILTQIEKMYRGRCSELYVGTGDSPLTVPFYKKCGFTESHRVKDFFTEYYDHPIVEGGVLLKDMVYFRKNI